MGPIARYLSTLVRDTPTAANVRAYADIVRERSCLRRLLEIGGQIERAAANGATSAEVIATGQNTLEALAQPIPGDKNLPQRVAPDDYAIRSTMPWLYRDLLPAESIVVVFGEPKSGKTHVIIDMTMHSAHGMHWQGYTLSSALRVAYLAGEGHSGLRVRLHAAATRTGNGTEGRYAHSAGRLSLPERLEDVLAVLADYGPDVIVADTLNAYFAGGNENSTEDMTRIVAAVRRLRDALHCPVIVVHHTGHSETARERGSIVRRGAADMIAQVARDESKSRPICLFEDARESTRRHGAAAQWPL